MDPEFQRHESEPASRLRQQPTPRASGWAGMGTAARAHDEAPPFALAVLAGGCASSAVDVLIFPLDTIKTRLQAQAGFHAAGGYRGLFRGVSAAAIGSAPGGALFFGTYEFSRTWLMRGSVTEYWPDWAKDATAACVGAIASCVLRNPAIVVQQRMQVGQYHSLDVAVRGVAREGGLAFYSGLMTSIAREIPFAFIQFPIYEALKRLWSHGGEHDITPSQGALCGSVAGAAAAAATTPLDLLKTRQMLGSRHGILDETREIVRTRGVSALFSGFLPRVGWMALGGYIFFGVYEQCMTLLLALQKQQRDAILHSPTFEPPAPVAAPQPTAHDGTAGPPTAHDGISSAPKASAALPSTPGTEPSSPASCEHRPVPQIVALLSGGLAGMVIDGALYPVDTYKTRTIQGLPVIGLHTGPLLSRLRELGILWRGIGAALLPAIPSAAAFFCTYEGVKNALESDGTFACCAAATTAEAASTMLRVPAELIKMKMQSESGAAQSTLPGVVRAVWAQGGLPSFYRGLGATLCLDLPFALLQFPLYESLRYQIADFRRRGRLTGQGCECNDQPEALDGALAGGIAGGIAAFLTTPLDVIRTRHVLWPDQGGKRRTLTKTVLSLARHEGPLGFWRGVWPRIVYMSAGGMLYLGTYSYCSTLMMRFVVG